MVRKFILALTLTIPSFAFAVDMDGIYITAKGGLSKTFNAGETNFNAEGGGFRSLENEDLGTGTAFGFSVGKYLTNNLRLELEAIKRTGYKYDARSIQFTTFTEEANIQTESLFVNGFYDFQPFSIRNTAITPYLGGGVGISRNKMGTLKQKENGVSDNAYIAGTTIDQFAYKLAAGTLVSITEQMSLDVNYQYVNLGAFKSDTSFTTPAPGVLVRPFNGGDIKTQELMIGLQYKF